MCGTLQTYARTFQNLCLKPKALSIKKQQTDENFRKLAGSKSLLTNNIII